MERDERELTRADLARYEKYLKEEERRERTVEQYLAGCRDFLRWLGADTHVSKERMLAYREALTARYRDSSVNAKLVAVNGLLAFLGWNECRVKQLRVQRQLFMPPEVELTKAEYFRLVGTARRQGKERLSVIMQCLCATGVRVSELEYFTVEQVRLGMVRVDCKGKIRTVLVPKPLQKLLLGYCRERGIGSGRVFVTRSGKSVDRSNIWREMKALCQAAGVRPGKVFPHNLRHLFARTYYQQTKDITRLADLLGHSSIDTTRIYTAGSGREQERRLSRLGLLAQPA